MGRGYPQEVRVGRSKELARVVPPTGCQGNAGLARVALKGGPGGAGAARAAAERRGGDLKGGD